MAGRLLVAAALCPLAFAFSNTVPLVSWSSKAELQDLRSPDLCSLDAVILVGQEGLHASDLRTLSPTSKFAQILSQSTSSRQLQYAQPQPDLSSTAESVAARCGFETIHLTPNDVPGHFTHGSQNVVYITLPSLEGELGGSRKDKVSLYTSQLADELAYLSSTYPNHLVIYTGTSSPSFTLQPRQAIAFDDLFIAPNTTLVDGGILKRYQLLTPGLITVLLVAFFILVPILMFGFRALASIQSPLETAAEAPGKFSAEEKKRQ
ncbi:hypothetical protein H0H92_013297 [Tricholoma furcatifolium]|nr:hypothetical protein H0H92_013297 [Tricholoma furcatifolium]